jgi:hydrogenase maturation protease
LIILDALTTGAAPGTIHRFTLPELRAMIPVRGASAHEGNAGELLNAAELLGELPDRLFVVGVEPQEIRTGFGLSSPVQDALPDAARQVTHLLTQLC